MLAIAQIENEDTGKIAVDDRLISGDFGYYVLATDGEKGDVVGPFKTYELAFAAAAKATD